MAFREAPGSGTRVGGPPIRRENRSARHRDGLHISSGSRGLGWVAPPAQASRSRAPSGPNVSTPHPPDPSRPHPSDPWMHRPFTRQDCDIRVIVLSARGGQSDPSSGRRRVPVTRKDRDGPARHPPPGHREHLEPQTDHRRHRSSRERAPRCHPRAPGSNSPPLRFVPVVVHERAPLTQSAEQLIDAVGGRVTRPLPLIGGFAADVPADRLSMLGPDGPIAGLYVDAPIRMAGIGTEAWDDLEPNLAWRKSIRLRSGPARDRRERRHGRDDRHRGRARPGPR